MSKIKQKLKIFIHRCHECPNYNNFQKHRQNKSTSKELEELSMNSIFNLPIGKDRYTGVIVVTDSFYKFTHFQHSKTIREPLKRQITFPKKSMGKINFVSEEVYAQNWLPRKLFRWNFVIYGKHLEGASETAGSITKYFNSVSPSNRLRRETVFRALEEILRYVVTSTHCN